VLVVAGAGSGKTRVITTRIVYLCDQGVSPYQILGMTFTNKAALEMKQRVALALARNVNDLTITTFHSFCARFLRREIGYLDRAPNFVIFDSQDQTTCLKRVIRNLNLPDKNFPASQFRNRISYLKNKGDWEAEPEAELEQKIFRAYKQELIDPNALDFDDLLLCTCRILEQFAECRDRYRRRFLYLMVDEYQDTNIIQARLINLLLNDDRNLCVVGDEDQSIYGWRGADIHNILDFERHYPGARIFKLEQNYRSTQSILDYANQAIAKNQLRKPKKLWTAIGKGRPVSIRDEFSGATEAEWIVQDIISSSRHDKLAYNHYAVLFRSNYLSRYLEEMFRRYQVPYQLIGGLKFYDRKEIKDLLSYMRIVVNPRDWTSFTRAVSVPSRGIGAKTLDKLYDLYKSGLTVGELLAQAVGGKLLSKRAQAGLKDFKDLYDKMSGLAESLMPVEWLRIVVEELDYLTYLDKQDTATAEYRTENINELLGSMQEQQSLGIQTLAQFMDFSALISDQDELEDDRPKVNLMTVHAAKGLEFDTVYVIGLEEGVFPNQRSIAENPNAVEEERRLFYVAVTRAKRTLNLSYARKRQTFGTTTANSKSRFLAAPGLDDEDPDGDDAGFDENGDDYGGYAPRRRPRVKATHFGDLSDQVSRMRTLLEKKGFEVDFSEVVEQRLRAGDVVQHAKFGTGTVRMVRGSGDQETVTVYFPGVGKKVLVSRMAKLKKVFK